MITYESGGVIGIHLLGRLHGSAAFKVLLPVLLSTGFLCFVHFVLVRYTNYSDQTVLDSFAFGAFISFVALLLTFRLNFAYQRYWEAAGSLYQMHSTWLDMAMTTAAFHYQNKLQFRQYHPRSFGSLDAAAVAATATAHASLSSESQDMCHTYSTPIHPTLLNPRQRQFDPSLQETTQLIEEVAAQAAAGETIIGHPVAAATAQQQKNEEHSDPHNNSSSSIRTLAAPFSSKRIVHTNATSWKSKLATMCRRVFRNTPSSSNNSTHSANKQDNDSDATPLAMVKPPVVLRSHQASKNIESDLSAILQRKSFTSEHPGVSNKSTIIRRISSATSLHSKSMDEEQVSPTSTSPPLSPTRSENGAMKCNDGLHRGISESVDVTCFDFIEIKRSTDGMKPSQKRGGAAQHYVSDAIDDIEKPKPRTEFIPIPIRFQQQFTDMVQNRIAHREEKRSMILQRESDATTEDDDGKVKRPAMIHRGISVAAAQVQRSIPNPTLFLQELAHLTSLMSAVALGTLRNNEISSVATLLDLALVEYVPGKPWPHLDPDDVTADDAEFNHDLWYYSEYHSSFKKMSRFVLGLSHTEKDRALYNAARPLGVLGGVSDAELELLRVARGPLAQMTLCQMWIKEFLSREYLANSMGDVESPIVSNVFGYLSAGQLAYDHARAIAHAPFVFPHAQITVVFALVLIFFFPLLFDSFVKNFPFAVILNFCTVACFLGKFVRFTNSFLMTLIPLTTFT
jgi:hypothetical protein